MKVSFLLSGAVLLIFVNVLAGQDAPKECPQKAIVDASRERFERLKPQLDALALNERFKDDAKRLAKERQRVFDENPAPPPPQVIPEKAEAPSSEPFLMEVEDVFKIIGRGTMVTGRVSRGKVKVNDTVEVVGIRPTKQVVVLVVEKNRKSLDEAATGDNVGLLLSRVERYERGQVIAKPGSTTPHTKFKAEAYIQAKEEGGRGTPFFTGYRSQFYFRVTDVMGMVKLPEGVERVMPGDKVTMEVELITPIAIEKCLLFTIRERGRTIGIGVITEIIE